MSVKPPVVGLVLFLIGTTIGRAAEPPLSRERISNAERHAEGEPGNPWTEIASAGEPLASAARLLLTGDAAGALRALPPDQTAFSSQERFVRGRVMLALGLRSLGAPLLTGFAVDDPLAAAAAVALVDSRGSLPIREALAGTELPLAALPGRVVDAFVLRDALRHGARSTGDEAARAGAELEQLRQVPDSSPFAIPARYLLGLRLSTERPQAPETRIEAARALWAVMMLVDAHDGARVSPARAAELDADRELAELALADLAFRSGALELSARLFDTIPRRSPRWISAQVGAVEADAFSGDYARAAARVTTLLHPGHPRRGRRRVLHPPALTLSVLELPEDDAPVEAVEAWLHLAIMLWQEEFPGCGQGPGPPALPGAERALKGSAEKVQARAGAWQPALRASQTPPAFAAMLANDAEVHAAEARLVEVRGERSRAAKLPLGGWAPRVSTDLSAVEANAAAELTRAQAGARDRAIARAKDLSTQAQIFHFEVESSQQGGDCLDYGARSLEATPR